MYDNLTDAERERPSAFCVAALRRTRATPLTRPQLAKLAGVTVRQLQLLETTKHLPRVVESVHAVALALQMPIEDLIRPQVREDHTAIIEQRREAFGAGVSSRL